MRTPLVVMVVLGAALFGAVGADRRRLDRRPRPSAAPVPVIAERVEALRGLRFTTVPEAVAVTPAQARKEGLEDFDRSYPVARRRADEELLKLLGLLEPDVSLRDISASVFSQGVAGYYDPRTKRLRTVSGAATSTRVLTEMVLAHELTHALEDQRYGLDNAGVGRRRRGAGAAGAGRGQRDRAHVPLRGGALHAGADDRRRARLARSPTPGRCRRSCRASCCSPTAAGETFVEFLLRRAGGRWTLVDLADRTRPPASTEQVMHPSAYLRVDAPQRVRLRR